jgi:hypothetical protein
VNIYAYDQALGAHILLASLAELTPAAPDARAADHPIADAQAGYFRAQGGHLASRFNAEDVGQLHAPPLLSAPGKNVQVIQSACPHSHQCLTRPRFRCGKVFVAQHFRAAALMHHHCFQVAQPPGTSLAITTNNPL